MTDHLSSKCFYINYVQILKLELWNISNVIRISLMQVIVPLWMMTWSNTLVYSCECVCFILLSFLVNVFFCVLCCLMFIVMFNIQKQLMQRLDQWNELYVCMYVCVRKTRVQVYEHYRLRWVCVKPFQQRCSLPHIGIHLHHYQRKHGLRQ